MKEDRKTKKNALSGVWPDVSNEKGARDTALIGAGVAAFVAVLTAAVALYSEYSSPVLGLNIWSLVDAFLFAAIAFGCSFFNHE